MEDFPELTTYGDPVQNNPAVRPPGGAPAAEPSTAGPLETVAEVWAAEARILSALRSDGRPLTLSQLCARTGMSVAELRRAVDRLCAWKSIRRLNTIIESFCPAGLH
jgi:MarR family